MLGFDKGLFSDETSSVEVERLNWELDRERYFIILNAFDYQLLIKEQKVKQLGFKSCSPVLPESPIDKLEAMLDGGMKAGKTNMFGPREYVNIYTYVYRRIGSFSSRIDTSCLSQKLHGR